MRSVFGLLVALTGLFIVWLWATGRASATWQAIVSGNASSGTEGATSNIAPAAVNLNPQALLNQIQPNLLQVTQPYISTQMPTIPTYIPTVGSTAFGIPAGTQP